MHIYKNHNRQHIVFKCCVSCFHIHFMACVTPLNQLKAMIDMAVGPPIYTCLEWLPLALVASKDMCIITTSFRDLGLINSKQAYQSAL